MRVVCDSGPLTHLWQIGQWQTFRTFDAIHAAAQVSVEVERHVPLVEMKTYAGCIERLFVHSTLYLSPGFKSYVRRLIAAQMTG